MITGQTVGAAIIVLALRSNAGVPVAKTAIAIVVCECEQTAEVQIEDAAFAAKLAKLGPAAHSQRAAAFADELDSALRAFDLDDARTSIRLEESGALVFQIASRLFRLSFAIERNDEESGWSFASHLSAGGILADGSLSLPGIVAGLRLALKPRTPSLAHVSEGCKSQVGFTMTS